MPERTLGIGERLGRARPKRTIVHLGSEVTLSSSGDSVVLTFEFYFKLILDGSDTTNAKQ